MALLLSQNGLTSNLTESNFSKKNPGGACPQTSLVLHAYACYIDSDTHVTLQKSWLRASVIYLFSAK